MSVKKVEKKVITKASVVKFEKQNAPEEFLLHSWMTKSKTTLVLMFNYPGLYFGSIGYICGLSKCIFSHW